MALKYKIILNAIKNVASRFYPMNLLWNAFCKKPHDTYIANVLFHLTGKSFIWMKFESQTGLLCDNDMLFPSKHQRSTKFTHSYTEEFSQKSTFCYFTLMSLQTYMFFLSFFPWDTKEEILTLYTKWEPNFSRV